METTILEMQVEKIVDNEMEALDGDFSQLNVLWVL